MRDDTSDIYVSAASAWEIATKARIGKLPQALAIARRLPEFVKEQGFLTLNISLDHAHKAGWLPGTHRDPFDRMLAAQSLVEQMPIATDDAAITGFGASVIW